MFSIRFIFRVYANANISLSLTPPPSLPVQLSARNVIRRDSLSQQVSWLQSNLTNLSNDLASLPQERKLTIPNVTIFDGCIKTRPQVLSCNIQPVIPDAVIEPCLSFYAPVEEEVRWCT